MQSSIGHMIDLVSLSLFSAYYSMIKKLPTTANRQITRIDDVYNKVKQSNQADIVSPNWSLPLSESEIVLDRCFGLLNNEPVYAEWDGVLSFTITNGINSIDLAAQLVATYPRLEPPRSYGPTNITRLWVHPDGVVVRIDGVDYTVGAEYRKGLLVYLDSSLSIDSVVELWQTNSTWRYGSDNFFNVCGVMSTDGTSYFVSRTRDHNLSSFEQFSTMTFDGSSYKYSRGINWAYGGVSYSLRNGFLVKDSTNIYTGFYPIVNFVESASPSEWGHPLYPVFIQFDGTYLYWGTRRTSSQFYFRNETYVKRLEVA